MWDIVDAHLNVFIIGEVCEELSIMEVRSFISLTF
jgi:hypothetical protein